MSEIRNFTFMTLLRSVFLIGGLAFVPAADVIGIETDSTACGGATFVDVNSSLRGYEDGATGLRIFRVEIVSSGILALDLAEPGPALGKGKLDFLGADCRPVRDGSLARIEESPTRALVDLPSAGAYFFRIDSQDPALALGDYKLRVGFASHESSGREPLGLSKSDTESPAENEEDIEEREIDEVLLVDPGAGHLKGTRSAPGQSSLALLLGLFQLCQLGELDDHGDVFTCATPSRLGERSFGEIRNAWGDDHDVFTFVVTAQQTVRIETDARIDTFGGLYDRRGQRLAKDDDSGAGANFRIVQSLGPGRYFIRVEGPNGSEGAYSLTVDTFGW